MNANIVNLHTYCSQLEPYIGRGQYKTSLRLTLEICFARATQDSKFGYIFGRRNK